MKQKFKVMGELVTKNVSSNKKSLKEEVISLCNDENFRQRCFSVVEEINRNNHEIEMLKLRNEIEIHQMTEKYNAFRYLLEKVYGERVEALSAHYKSLDYGLENNDKEIIIESLKGITNIVVKNPLDDFLEFERIMKSPNETLVLDF